MGCYVKNDKYIELEKISDIDKYLFIEKGLRGGIFYIAKRYSKANNKSLNDYNPKKPSTFISYLDMNNLYGWAMSKYLPSKGLKWLKNIDKSDIMLMNDKNPIGYFLEVDLEYPDELHKLHNDFPLSKYCKKDADKYEIKVGEVKKLIPNLGSKTN